MTDPFVLDNTHAAVDPVDEAACQGFAQRHGTPDVGPVTVIIPAYREAASIRAVVDAIPPEAHGLRVATLVVVDGPDDETISAADATGAFVCVAPVNRGQGAVLKLGYRLARNHGGRYLVTIDADGQYDPSEIPELLEPIVAGTADFVSGSRRLGANFQRDRVREFGVIVYAALVSMLTFHRLTDPSFGLRAMRAEVPCSLTLRQPQYQAGELLVAAIMNGYRVAERPATMRARSGGSSHKGSNLRYGWKFGSVIVSTWYRERRARRGSAG
jgi:hypothetical protein